MKQIIAIEPGSSKIRGSLGVIDPTGAITVRAIHEVPLIDAVCHGQVRNVAAVADAIQSIIQRLIADAPNRRVTGVYIAMGGRSTHSSVMRLERRLPSETMITARHSQSLTEEALSTILNDRDIIEVQPVKYAVDGISTANPVGMFGREVQATFTVVSASRKLKRNLQQAIENTLNLDIHGFIPRSSAQARLVLSTEELRLGVMMIDFGAETTTISIYKNDALQFLSTLPMGSRNITRDIMSLNHLEENAERMKCRSGSALPPSSAAMPDHLSANDREADAINEYVRARAGEIVANIAEQFRLSGFRPEDLPCGIVTVGAGAKLNGFNALLERELHLCVRMGVPQGGIRFADSRLRPVDNIDVVATLLAAARLPEPKECLASTVEPQKESQAVADIPTIGGNDVVEADDEPEPEIEHEQRNGGLGRMFRNLGNRLRNTVSNAMTENEDLVDDK